MARKVKGHTAAIRKQQSELVKAFRAELESHGATLKEEEWQVEYTLDTKLAGVFTFSMLKRDEKEASDLFSIYIRVRLGLTWDEVHAIGAKITTGHFNGKWNIHSSSSENALDLLKYRLDCLMNP